MIVLGVLNAYSYLLPSAPTLTPSTVVCQKKVSSMVMVAVVVGALEKVARSAAPRVI